MLKAISRTFIAGLLAVLPLALTLAILLWLVEFIHRGCDFIGLSVNKYSAAEG